MKCKPACSRAKSGAHRDGQSEKEGRAMVKFALCANRAQVRERDVFGNGEPQTGPSRFAGARLVDAVKALEEARQMLRADPRAESTKIKFDPALAIPRAQDNFAAGRGILHRILNQVREDLVDGFTISVDGSGGNFFDGEFDP